MYELNVLNIEDELADIEFMSEMAVTNAMLDAYMKQAIMLEYASEEVVQECCYVQEGVKESWTKFKDDASVGIKGVKGEGVLKKILMFIPRLIGSFVKWLRKLFGNSKKTTEDIQEAADIVQNMSDEEFEEMVSQFDNAAAVEPAEPAQDGTPSKKYKFKGRPYDRHLWEDMRAGKMSSMEPDVFKKYLDTEYKTAKLLKRACDSFDGSIPRFAKNIEAAFVNDEGTIKTRGRKRYVTKSYSASFKYLDTPGKMKQVDMTTQSIKDVIRQFDEVTPYMDKIIKVYEDLAKEFAAGSKIMNYCEKDLDDDRKEQSDLKYMIYEMQDHINYVVNRLGLPFHYFAWYHTYAKFVLAHRHHVKNSAVARKIANDKNNAPTGNNEEQ